MYPSPGTFVHRSSIVVPVPSMIMLGHAVNYPCFYMTLSFALVYRFMSHQHSVEVLKQ